MDLARLKYRELDKAFVVIYAISTPVQIEIEGRVKTRKLYTFVGINIEGKRRYLTHGIDHNEDTDFWMQKFKNISRRGVEKVLYITLGEEKGKRAAQITFSGIKVVPDLFQLIDKTFPYFADTYKNKMPEEIRKLYTYETKEEYKKELQAFMYKYGDKEIVKILLENDLKNIEKVYEIPHNVRKVKKEINRIKVIEEKEEFMRVFENQIEKWEAAMYITKAEWIKILEELMIEDKEVVRYL